MACSVADFSSPARFRGPSATVPVSLGLSAPVLDGAPYLSNAALSRFLSASLFVSFVIGLLLFLSDIRAYTRLLGKLSAASGSGHHRLPELQEKALILEKCRLPVFIQDELHGAFNTDVLKPRIWIH